MASLAPIDPSSSYEEPSLQAVKFEVTWLALPYLIGDASAIVTLIHACISQEVGNGSDAWMHDNLCWPDLFWRTLCTPLF
jgi:hypothetical protein